MTKFIDTLTVIMVFLSACFCMYCVAFMLDIVQPFLTHKKDVVLMNVDAKGKRKSLH